MLDRVHHGKHEPRNDKPTAKRILYAHTGCKCGEIIIRGDHGRGMWSISRGCILANSSQRTQLLLQMQCL